MKIIKKGKPGFTSYLGFAVLALGAGLAFLSPTWLFASLRAITVFLALSGVVWLLGQPQIRHYYLRKTEEAILTGNIFFIQIFVLLISFLFFYQCEIQTRLNPRLQSLDQGYIIHLIQTKSFILGWLPWLLYAVIGLALGYLTQKLGRSPALGGLILPHHKKHPALFFFNYIRAATDITASAPILFILSLSIIYLVETCNRFLGWPSLFSHPFKTILEYCCVYFILYTFSGRILKKMISLGLGLGGIYLSYGLILSLILLWSHGFMSTILSMTNLVLPNGNVKSPLGGEFSVLELETRLNLLIWGWWSILLPWMVSVTLKYSQGFTMWRAILKAMCLPTVVFLVVIPNLSPRAINLLYSSLDKSWLKGLITASLLVVVYGFSQKLYAFTNAVIHDRRSFNPEKTIRFTAINKVLMSRLNLYLLAVFVMGWFPTQVILTLGAEFIATVCLGVIITLFLPRLFAGKSTTEFNNEISISPNS